MHKTHSTLSWQHSNFLQQQQHMQTTNQLQSTVINANALPYAFMQWRLSIRPMGANACHWKKKQQQICK